MAGTGYPLVRAAGAQRGGVAGGGRVGEAKLWMGPLSGGFFAGEVARQRGRIRWTGGCYECEGAGVTLFDRVEGDPWTIIGMPMLPLLAWLRATGLAPS